MFDNISNLIDLVSLCVQVCSCSAGCRSLRATWWTRSALSWERRVNPRWQPSSSPPGWATWTASSTLWYTRSSTPSFARPSRNSWTSARDLQSTTLEASPPPGWSSQVAVCILWYVRYLTRNPGRNLDLFEGDLCHLFSACIRIHDSFWSWLPLWTRWRTIFNLSHSIFLRNKEPHIKMSRSTISTRQYSYYNIHKNAFKSNLNSFN